MIVGENFKTVGKRRAEEVSLLEQVATAAEGLAIGQGRGILLNYTVESLVSCVLGKAVEMGST